MKSYLKKHKKYFAIGILLVAAIACALFLLLWNRSRGSFDPFPGRPQKVLENSALSSPKRDWKAGESPTLELDLNKIP